MNKKILVLANRYSTIIQFRSEVMATLCQLGYDVYISLPFDKQKYMDQLKSIGCRLIDAPMERHGTNPLNDLKLLKYYKKIIKEVKPDLILTYTVKPNVYGNLAAKCFKIPVFSTITGLGSVFLKEKSLNRTIVSFLYKISLPYAKKVFFQNEGNKKILFDLGSVKEEQAIMTPGSGVNCKKFVFSEYPENDGKICFISVMRLMKEKGMEELIYAIEKLQNRYDNLKFVFIGRNEDGYQEKVKELEEKGLIEYLGFQDDVPSFIRKANCLILPSFYSEGMNNSLLEASAMGRPVITTDWFGCKESVIDGKTGFICQPRDGESLYNAIVKFIELPYNQKVQMGREANKFVTDNFNRNTVIDIYIKEIEKCLNI